MVQKIRIGIVEDEAIIAHSISMVLESLGYDVLQPCASYDQAIAMLEKNKPDLALLDIKLKRGKDGIDVASYIRQNMDIPFIFLTANSDPATLERAKSVKPDAFLVKPFQKEDIYTSIEIAINNFTSREKQSEGSPKIETPLAKDSIFIKDGYYFHKVKFDDILYISSENVYVTIHTAKKKFLTRATLQDYLEKFDETKFVRVHQRYAVNINMVDKINTACLIINNEEIPVSKSYHHSLMTSLKIG